MPFPTSPVPWGHTDHPPPFMLLNIILEKQSRGETISKTECHCPGDTEQQP